MSELREECYKCLNNQECISAADYGSVFCMAHRKFKMPSNKIEQIEEDLYEHKITPNQAREKMGLPKIQMGNSNITILPEYRPCKVSEKIALFHKWVHTKNLLGQEFEVGIVEYEDGKIEEVTPNNIRFCDNKLKEYSFKEARNAKKS